MTACHGKETGQLLRELESDARRGLEEQEAVRRLGTYGPNELAGEKKRSLAARLLEQLKDPMVLVLLAAAGLSVWAGGGRDWLDAAIILVIVAANAVISVVQEGNARRALEALRKMSAPTARVIRGGVRTHTAAAALVPGDLIELEAGDQVPADARILECAGLKADESAMTGESVPVEKAAVGPLPAETALGDRRNMVLSGTAVTAGSGLCLVTATGMDTEMGRIAGALLTQRETETPLRRRMGEISRTLSFLCLCVCAVMFGVGLLQGKELLGMFMTAVSLAVAAIPEGLSAIVTIVLALGVQRLAGRGAIIKKLPAVETLGCAGVICSDKTGTLTENRMTVTRVWTPGEGNRALALTIGTVCGNAVWEEGAGWTGDPTETAIAALAAAEGLDKGELEAHMPRQGELPFDSQRKLMTTIHKRPGGGWLLYVKGAPDVLARRCTRVDLGSGRTGGMTQPERERILGYNAAMARDALRVLAVAWREVEFLPKRLEAETLERELTFVGLLGMTDPPRREVKAAVAQCYAAGIRPVMITGDHKLTALAVARELEIFRPGDRAVTGEELDFMPQELLEQEVERFSVYARVSPEHKMRIVRAWQARGQVVAMTGDGVNDAPALKAADIGCAMGRSGTDVAKGASHLILTDDNFSTIVAAVAEGRGIYANIKKAIHYLLSCNIGEIVTVFLATVLDFRQLPLKPVQLLWLNLVTDSLPALALGVEPVEGDVMTQKPRPARENLFTGRFAWRLFWQGTMIAVLTLTAYFLGGRLLAAPGLEDATANTMAFATLTLSQLFHAFNARSEESSLFKMGVLSNPAMNRAFLAGLAMQLGVLCLPPLMPVFGVTALSLGAWGAVLALAAAPVAVCELVKAAARRRPPRQEGQK